MKRFRILIADDHPVVREGLATVINRQPDMFACAEADSTPTVLAALDRERPDALLLDLFLERHAAVDLIREAMRLQPGLRILVISIQSEQLSARRCLEAGASAYVSKTRSLEEIILSLRSVLAGDTPSPFASFPDGKSTAFTRAESEAVALALEGLDNQQIAQQLGISISAVKLRLHGAYRKLGVQNRTQLAAWLRG